jgi:hypothetical protein
MWGVDKYNHVFLTSALVGGEWSVLLYTRERAAGTHWIGGWVDPRAGLDDKENGKFLTLPELELRPFSRPTRSQSIHRRMQEDRSQTNFLIFSRHEDAIQEYTEDDDFKFEDGTS